MTRFRDAARKYAAHGIPVLPLRPRGKEAIIPGGFHSASCDPDQVDAWWCRWPEANIGCPPGRAGYVVIEWDTQQGREVAQELGLYAEPRLIVESARGEHIYGEHPGGHVGNRKLLDVLDVRADAGYVVLPPSVHPSGVIYRAHGTFDQVRPFPPKVIELLQPPDPPESEPSAPVDPATPRGRRYVQRAIELEAMAVANAPAPTPTTSGNRNNRLNEAAFSLARFCGAGEADPVQVAEVLTIAARHAGLRDHEIRKTIRSAFTARGVSV